MDEGHIPIPEEPPPPDVDVDAFERSLARRQKIIAIAAIGFGVALSGMSVIMMVASIRLVRLALFSLILGVGFVIWGVTAFRKGEAAATALIERMRNGG